MMAKNHLLGDRVPATAFSPRAFSAMRMPAGNPASMGGSPLAVANNAAKMAAKQRVVGFGDNDNSGFVGF
jgi:hypothetical protein